MEWQIIAEKIMLACSVTAGVVGLLELIFKPIRRIRAAAKERRERWDQLAQLLREHVCCCERTDAIDERLKTVERIVAEQAEAIQGSKAERYVTWKALRAILDGQKQAGANGLVTEAIRLMDDFSDKHMR